MRKSCQGVQLLATGAQRAKGTHKVTWATPKTQPCGKYEAVLGFALAEQELQGQFHVILGQHFFDGAGLQCLRQRQARREDTAQGRELVRQALQFLLLGGGGAGTLPPGELLGIPPQIVELGAMRLAQVVYL
jgi:hypothetical protein